MVWGLELGCRTGRAADRDVAGGPGCRRMDIHLDRDLTGGGTAWMRRARRWHGSARGHRQLGCAGPVSGVDEQGGGGRRR
uniref:Uncharacterized protein n=1 Tax=Setaria italica TaxID=4555 RepID=K3ZGT5_SETIT